MPLLSEWARTSIEEESSLNCCSVNGGGIRLITIAILPASSRLFSSLKFSICRSRVPLSLENMFLMALYCVSLDDVITLWYHKWRGILFCSVLNLWLLCASFHVFKSSLILDSKTWCRENMCMWLKITWYFTITFAKTSLQNLSMRWLCTDFPRIQRFVPSTNEFCNVYKFGSPIKSNSARYSVFPYTFKKEIQCRNCKVIRRNT